jgi:hypothetical protein
MNKHLLIIASISAITLGGCNKLPGEGGSSTIKGVVVEKRMSSVGTVISQYPASNEDVFIIYGEENTFHDDRERTSYDGSFEFRYLQPGKYKIFVYEECPSCPGGKNAVMVETEISKKKSVVNLDTIYIRNY